MEIIKKISKGVDFLIEKLHQKHFSRYHRMLQFGEIDKLLDEGASYYVIANFANFRLGNKSHTDRDAYAPYVMMVTPAMMRNYLYSDPENFYFFVMHPKGLQVLAEEGFSGVIARFEKDFIANAKNFPESFKLTKDSHREYVELVNSYLEAGLMLPQ